MSVHSEALQDHNDERSLPASVDASSALTSRISASKDEWMPRRPGVVAVATANSFTSFEVSRAFARLLDFDGFTGVNGGITALSGVGRFDRNVSFGHIKEGPSSAITGVANRAS
jgi:hypothetical protein